MPEDSPSPTASGTLSHPFFKPNALLFVLLVILVTAFYLPSSRFGFIYDDHRLVVNAPRADSLQAYGAVFTERHWEGLPYYRPISRLTMVVQKAIHGNQPGPYHVFNALLMGIASGLCFVLLKSPPLGIPTGFAFWAAIIFSIHPIASSTVYPICSGRETLLPAVFSLAAMIFWLKGRPRDRGLAFVFFAFALFSKEQAVVLPVLFVLVDLLGVSTQSTPGPMPARNWTSIFLRHLPSLAILLVYILIRLWLFRETNQHQIAVWDDPMGPVYSFLYALQVTFAPFKELVYEPPVEVWLTSWRMAVALFAASVLLLFAFRQTATRHVVLLCLSWIGLTLLPTANVLKQEAQFAERYVLLALVGVLGIAGTLAASHWRQGRVRHVILGLEIVAVAAFGAISFHRGGFYQNDIAFHEQWIRTNPASLHAHRSLGWAWLERGDLDKAEWHLQAGLQLDPENAEIWNNLGNVAHRRGKRSEAEMLYRNALSLNPNFAESHSNLGMVLGETNRIGEAEQHFRRAIELRPHYSEAHNGLGIVMARQNQPEKARGHFEEALEWDPQNTQAHYNLAIVHKGLGNRKQAQFHLKKVQEIDANYPGLDK